MKLYDCKGAVNPRRVDIFLAEKGIEIDRVQVDVFGGEHRSDKFRKLNPSCTVPFLELDDGVVISESTAISRYIEGQQPQPPLMGKTPQEQAYISMWQRRVEDGLLYAAQHLPSRDPWTRGAGPIPQRRLGRSQQAASDRNHPLA